MTAIIIFSIGVGLMLISIPIHRFERHHIRQWFLSPEKQNSENFIKAYWDKKLDVLTKMGWGFNLTQLMIGAFVMVAVMMMLPFAFRETWELALLFGVIGALVFDFGIRLYGLRYHVRFEKGLRESALPIGLETLAATGEASQAINDILRISRDKIMLREFENVQHVMAALTIPPEKAMLIRAEQLEIPVYLWLARYTLKMQQFGANTGEAWNDVLEELEDRDILRTRVLSKTSSIRFGAYAFGVGYVGALLFFFHLIAPLMTGMMPFFLVAVTISVAVGIYRLSRLGGDTH